MADGFQRQWPALEMRAGALPFRSGAGGALEILLIRRIGHDGWCIPKGRLMIFRSAHDSARIEAQEEAGAYGRVGRDAIGSYLHVKAAGSNGRRSEAVEVVVFPLEVAEVSATWPEMQERERLWVHAEEAAGLVASGHLRHIISSFASAQLSEPMNIEVSST